MSNGKGSTRRPKQISDDELAARWALAFGGWQRHSEHVLMRDECSYVMVERFGELGDANLGREPAL